MDISALIRPEKPWLHLRVADDSDAAEIQDAMARSTSGTVAVRVVHGSKCRTKTDFFKQVSAALEFPSYFGQNWDAFEECVTDLEWLPADVYLLVIPGSIHLLEKEPASQQYLLLQILEGAGQAWGQPVHGEWARPAKPFHVVFQCAKEEEAAMTRKLEAARVAFTVLSE